jgi:hypothetical protein
MNRYVGNLSPMPSQGGSLMDIYDDAEWTEMDVDDLRPAIEHDRSIGERPNSFVDRAPLTLSRRKRVSWP